MEIEYKLNKNLFKKYANEYYSKASLPIYCLVVFILLLAILFLFLGIFKVEALFTSTHSFIFCVMCVVADLFILTSVLLNKKRFVESSIKIFDDKFKDLEVTYKISFDENSFTITNNINNDKRIVSISEVKRVILTKDFISIFANNNVFLINRLNIKNEDLVYIISKLPYKKSK